MQKHDQNAWKLSEDNKKKKKHQQHGNIVAPIDDDIDITSALDIT